MKIRPKRGDRDDVRTPLRIWTGWLRRYWSRLDESYGTERLKPSVCLRRALRRDDVSTVQLIGLRDRFGDGSFSALLGGSFSFCL
jgi:hypothetical protein